MCTLEMMMFAGVQELLAEMDKLNKEGIDGYVVGSADVEALYPSLDIKFTIEKVCELFLLSNINIEGIDYKELSLYISLNKTEVQIREMGLHKVCPERNCKKGPRPNMTGCGMNENKEDRYKPWKFPNI